MRQKSRPHQTCTRIKKRSAIILALASVAALATGGIASAHDTNTSSVPTWAVTTPTNLINFPGNGPIPPAGSGAGATGPAKLTFGTNTIFHSPGNKTEGGFIQTLTMLFDDDIVINLAGIPSCTLAAQGGGGFTLTTSIAHAWERCGPGADTDPEVNAYLSPDTAVSGGASTVPAPNYDGCTLVFKKNATQVLIFIRLTLMSGGTANCFAPQANVSGNATFFLTGTLSAVNVAEGTPRPASERLRTQLNIPNVDDLQLSLDRLSATLGRANVVKARCVDDNRRLNIRAIFDYSPSTLAHPAATDTVGTAGAPRTSNCT